MSSSILLDVDYEIYRQDGQDLAKLVLYLREDRSRTEVEITDIQPYFYVDCTADKLRLLLSSNPTLQSWYSSHEEVIHTTYEGGKTIGLLKIYGLQPWKVPQIREIFRMQGIDHFEADIPFTHRFMIDHQLQGLQAIDLQNLTTTPTTFDPLVCSLDIEVASENIGSFGDLIEKGDRRVTAIGLAWDPLAVKSKAFVLESDSDVAEIEMLRQCFSFLHQLDPDILVTYNGDNFDLPYLVKRLDNLGLSSELMSPTRRHKLQEPSFGNGWKAPGLLIYDLYKQTRWLYTDDGRKTLDSVAKKLLGEAKLELDYGHGELWRLSLTSPEHRQEFESYTLRDAELTCKLWDGMDMAQWLEVIKICGGPPGDAMYFTERQAGEFLVFQTMFQMGILIPPAPSAAVKKVRKKERKSAMGGYVMDPIRDISTAVLIADFASMYPTIIVGHNIGGESFRGISHPLSDRFRAKPQTSMKVMQQQLLKKRFAVKAELVNIEDEQQRKRLKAYSWGLKIVANSTFGAYNFIGSRFYDTDLAGTITALGRDYVKTISSRVEEFNPNFKAIYGDTDSVFIETDLDLTDYWEGIKPLKDPHEIPGVEEMLAYLHRFLPDAMKLELEDVAYRILFHKGAKKRYAYVSLLDRDIHIKGFEAIRNDFSRFARKIQRRAFELLLRSGDLEATKSTIIGDIQELLDLPKDELTSLVTTYGPLKKEPTRYKSTPPAVTAYLHYKREHPEVEDWKDIAFFPFIITKGSGSQTDRARHPEMVRTEVIDLDHYIMEALRSINRFNLNITLDEAKGVHYLDVVDYFDT